MKILDLTLETPEKNLCCDEALLDESEASDGDPVLRFWMSPEPFIVLGYSNAWKDEVKSRDGLPVHRRCSGGGTVVQGPGCLNYSLILPIEPGTPSDGIRSTNEFVMEKNRQALTQALGKEVLVRGLTDLALGDRKFSGNSQRRRRTRLLFHGTFLLDFDLALIEKHLKMPPKQPCYRENRPHSSFVSNIGLPEARVKDALKKIWGAEEKSPGIPHARLGKLAEQYAREDWRFKF